jgi:hypothetical protein
MASALREVIFRGLLPGDLAEAVRETAECLWVLRYAPKGSPDATKHAAKWLHWRNLAVRHRLLALNYSDPSLDAIRVALLMWILTSMVPLGLKRLGNLIAPTLHLMLRNAGRALDQYKGLFEVRMWVLTIGAMCSIIDSEDEKWFVEQLVEIGFVVNIRRFQQAYPTTDTLDALQGFQERFFYYDSVQRPRLERLARFISGGQDFGSNPTSQGSPSESSRKSRSPT